MISTRVVFCFVILVTSACATKSGNDPLQNTKKLIKEGHEDLYENGALQIPQTEIKLIPPGPSVVSLASEMAGLRARQSFLTSLKNAQDAVYVVANGTKKAYRTSQKIYDGGQGLANAITEVSRPTGKAIVLRSAGDAYGIVGGSFQFSRKTNEALKELKASLEAGSKAAYVGIQEDSSSLAKSIDEDGTEISSRYHQKAFAEASTDWSKGKNKFVSAYVGLPERWSNSASMAAIAENNQAIGQRFVEDTKWQNEKSQEMKNLVKTSGDNYFTNIGNSLGHAKDDFNSLAKTDGINYAALRAGQWVLQALFYDAIIAPLSQATYGSLGYVFVNGIAYPVLLAKDGTLAVVNSAVLYTWDGASKTASIVAPTLEGALAATLLGANFVANESIAGGSYVGSKVGYVSAKGIGFASAVAVRGGAYASSQAVYYIGVPVTTAGIAVGGAAVATLTGAAEVGAGSAVYVGGEAAQVASRAAGATVSGAFLATTATLSAAAGAGLVVYEVGKSVAVPASYELGSGIVLGYGSMTHLAAQSVLAVSDAAYLVLSLEGPRWVIYAVKGRTGDGSSLPAGAVVNLNEMKKSGEQFEYVPASPEEVKSVIEALPQDLPKQPH